MSGSRSTVLLLGVCLACFSRARAADAPANSPPLRLAIAAVATSQDTESLSAQGGVLGDLLTSRLSNELGFELLERAALERVLKEQSMSLSGLAQPDQAVRIGKLLRADWFLLPAFLKVERTNLVLAKIVDARTGIIHDLTTAPLQSTNLLASAEALASFVTVSRASIRSLGERLFLAFGSFENLGFNNRYPEFGDRLRSAMARRLAGPRVSVVERTHVTPLLNELRLSLGGLSKPATNAAAAQPAFVIVDGFYQSYQDEQSKINLVLRFEPLGGPIQTRAFKEMPGEPLETKVAAAIVDLLGSLKTNAPAPTPQAEVKAQIDRGMKLGRIRGLDSSLAGYPPFDGFRDKRAPVLTDAIRAFESALLLEPDNIEAKYHLARCLADPHIDKREQARDYWREIIATSTDAPIVIRSRRALAASYRDEDDFQAIELFSQIKREATDLAEIADCNHALQSLYEQLGREGKVSGEFIINFATEVWRTDCRLALLRGETNQWLDVYGLFETPQNRYSLGFKTRGQAMRDHVAAVITNLTIEFPRLTPYLVAGHLRWLGELYTDTYGYEQAVSQWRGWYREVLAQCEKRPETILAPDSFYSRSLWRDLGLFLRRKDYELGELVTGLLQKQARQHLDQAGRDTLDLYTGYYHFRREQYLEALRAFERLGDREVRIDLEGPWGKGPVAVGSVAAQVCRERLAARQGTPAPAPIETGSTPESIPVPRPIKTFRSREILFTVADNRVWVADDANLVEYDPDSGSTRAIPLHLPLEDRSNSGLAYDTGSAYSSIAAAKGRIWIGTRKYGLLGVEMRSGLVTNYTVESGLLTTQVPALLAVEERLWVGCAGGMGYVELDSGRFVGMMPQLPADLQQAPGSGSRSPRLATDGPAPRAYIQALARSPSGRLWAATTMNALSYDSKSNRWQRFPTDCPTNIRIANLAATEEHLVLPCYEPTGGSSALPQYAGLLIYDLQQRQCRRLTLRDGLPSENLRSVVIEGEKAWIGGAGFVAVVDLPAAKVQKVCKLQTASRVRCLELVGNDVWFSAGPGLYRMSKDGRPVAAPPVAQRPRVTQPNPPEAGAPRDAEAQLIEALKSARALMTQRAELYRVYGNAHGEDLEALTTQFNQIVRRVAPSFPTIDLSTNQVARLILNKRGAGLDGFRFRNPTAEAKNFAWLFAVEGVNPVDYWFILPADPLQKMRGFTVTSEPKLVYTNAPWSGLKGVHFERMQFLRDASILPDKEYIMWFSFRDEAPKVLHLMMGLFPTSELFSSRSFLDEAFGLKGKLKYPPELLRSRAPSSSGQNQ